MSILMMVLVPIILTAAHVVPCPPLNGLDFEESAKDFTGLQGVLRPIVIKSNFPTNPAHHVQASCGLGAKSEKV